MEDNGYTAFHFNLTDFCVVETAYTETYNCTVVDVCATKSFKVSQTVINTEACIPTLAVFISLFASIVPIPLLFSLQAPVPSDQLPPKNLPPDALVQPTAPPTTATPPQRSRTDPLEDFDFFIASCNKSYASRGEKMFRKDIFDLNVEKVRRGQLLFKSGQRSYNQKINCFGDLTFSEYGSKYTGFGNLAGDSAVIDGTETETERIVTDIRRNARKAQQAGELDWFLKGNVSPVTIQGNCNSCAAHAAASAVESCLSIAANTPPQTVSHQQLVDCTDGLGAGKGTELERFNRGCDYGFPDLHLKYITNTRTTVQSLEEYPSTPTVGTCRKQVTDYGSDDYDEINKQYGSEDYDEIINQYGFEDYGKDNRQKQKATDNKKDKQPGYKDYGQDNKQAQKDSDNEISKQYGYEDYGQEDKQYGYEEYGQDNEQYGYDDYGKDKKQEQKASNNKINKQYEYDRQGQIASVSDHQYKYFATEDDLFKMLQSGPVVTIIDVGEAFHFLGDGILYDTKSCTNYEDEPIPQECRRVSQISGESGYTCLGNCKNKLPLHCDRFLSKLPPKRLTFQHAITIVGYGRDRNGQNFWKFKNSHGTQWGDKGYGKIYRGVGNCGVGSYVMQPVCG